MNTSQLVKQEEDVSGLTEVKLWEISDSNYEIEKVIKGTNKVEIEREDNLGEALARFYEIINYNKSEEEYACKSCGSEDLVVESGGEPTLGYEYHVCETCGNKQEKEN